MSKDQEDQLIEPEFLGQLAEKAMQEEKRMGNPYLKALMARFGRLALELKTALENEGGLNGNRAHSVRVTKGLESE